MKLALFTGLVAGAWSQSKSATMTLYKDGFALLKQPVTWQVPAGKSTIKYSRLPEGLFVDSPFLNLKGARILSQRLDNNVFSGDQYFKGKLGEVVEVLKSAVRNPRREYCWIIRPPRLPFKGRTP
ncbi:MAG: hypothetical protein GXO92_05375 [FCB group bacterium]|nr:hypothetical protein [FCB group bacterium]